VAEVPAVEVVEPVEVKEEVKEEVEEEEPPEYHFEPEPMDLRPSDMYLDTVSIFTVGAGPELMLDSSSGESLSTRL
jgi:hypothetical protein